jgi:hypothetical protein
VISRRGAGISTEMLPALHDQTAAKNSAFEAPRDSSAEALLWTHAYHYCFLECH